MDASSIFDRAASAIHYSSTIERMVRDLKAERDTQKARANMYKTAFDDQTTILRELTNVCIATQAELENERARKPQKREASESTLATFSTKIIVSGKTTTHT